ncbi:MAG: EAL domain-containing protein [Granulosicoccus sp.]|nr:EAL domain-containing protein [Granulosicoccus sp.]
MRPFKNSSESRLQLLAQLSVPLYLYNTDTDHVIWANEAALEFWCATSPEELYKRDFSKGMSAGVKKKLLQTTQDCYQKNTVAMGRWTVYPLGTPKTADFRMSAFALNDLSQILLIEVQQEAELISEDVLYGNTALMHTNTMIAAFDHENTLVYTNNAARDCLPDACEKIEDLLHNPLDINTVFVALSDSDHCDIELEINTRNGVRWHSTHIQRGTNPKTASLIFIVSAIDSTERRLAQQRAHELAYTDPLTSLPNRAALFLYLEQLLASCHSDPNASFGLFFLDLDRFKLINDSLGHATGDLLLVDVSIRLSKALDNKGSVYRLGGDEFVMVVTRCSTRDDLKKLAETIIFAMSEPVILSETELRVLPSIGVCLYPDDGASGAKLMEHADAAMYIAKKDRKGYCFYDDQMSNSINETVKEKLSIENDMVSALKNDQFSLFFQPKIACRNLSVCGVEALIRWHHPSKGIVPPDKFIGIAEESGQIIDLGNWVLIAAMRQQKIWQRQGIQIPVSVNISARQFHDNDLLSNVSDALELTDCDPHMLELEITESMLVGEPDNVHSTLLQLSSMGVRLALDDFGTGYSNLAYLQAYPLDTLKIDKEFLADRQRSMLLGTILNMGKVLGLNVVAEGVETSTQADWLIARGCDQMQGYYFSKPLPVQQATTFLAENGAPQTKSPDSDSTDQKAA